jgi:hypothetical protein
MSWMPRLVEQLHDVLRQSGWLGTAGLAMLALSCSSASQSHPSTAAEASPAVAFTEVTEAAGMGRFRHQNGAVGKKWYPEMMGSGGGFLDYDGDGWLDLLLLGGGTWEAQPNPQPQALWLYRNNGDGTFTERTTEAGLAGIRAYTIGLAAADYDNDGDEDFALTNLEEDLLFRNDGGRFNEVAASAGVGQHREWGSSPLFFDADRDGYLDLFMGNYVDWSPETDKWCPEGSAVKLYCIPADYEGIPSRFYRNNGDGTFTDHTATAGFLPVKGKALGVVELDYDHDGWSDLYVATDGEGNLLYHNDGDGTFTERGILSGVAFSEHGAARAGMGADAGVVDSTGETTLFVGNFSEEPVSVYHHLSDGLFADRAAASRLAQPSFLTLTFGLILFDVDLDGDLDLLTANGHVYPDRLKEQDKITFEQRAQVYLNRGNGTFDEVIQEQGSLSLKMVARAAAYADYDRDGDLDVLLTENNGPAHLWRNDLPRKHYLHLRLHGRQSNRDALGARIVAWQAGQAMERRIRTGSSYLSQSEKAAVFGLGQVSWVDSVVVEWPSGRRDRWGRLEGNRRLYLVEGDTTWQLIPTDASIAHP